MRREIAESLEKNRHEMEERLQLTKNFDLVERKLKVGDRDACLYFVDGFVKDEVLEKLMEFFQSLKPELLLENGKAFSGIFVPYVEVDILNSFEELTTQLLSGVACLLIDGIPCCVAVDCRTYPMRSVEEPEKDKVLRGSRDGFVETLVFNTALIRRRIRTPKLSMEILTTGKLSNTERPDAAAAGILEGKLVILVDNSPSAMILPASVFDIMEEADDFYFPPVTGTYLRLTRFFIGLMTIFLTPVWLLLMQNPEWIPKGFQFIRVSEEINIPIFFQLLILELAIDGLLTAILNQWGLLLGFVLVCVFLATNRTISGGSYLAPLLPFNGKQFTRRFFQKRLTYFYD